MAKRTSPERTAKTSPSAAALGGLIETLAPLNNRWREAGPADKVLTLWDMGEALIRAVPEPSDEILWEIQRRSYLTRMLLRYSLIVRRGWPERRELELLVRGLVHYSVFREALPFLKGRRAGVDTQTYERVVAALRDPNTRVVTRFIKSLKATHIGKTRSTGVSAAAVRPHAAAFRASLDTLWTMAFEGRPGVATPEYADAIVELSRVAVTLATGDDRAAALPKAVQYPEHVWPVAEALASAVAGGRDATAAFRKGVGAARLMQAADLLNALRSEQALTEWRRRNREQRSPRAATGGAPSIAGPSTVQN